MLPKLRHENLLWLFLPKHKLELMFSSIEPYAPRRCYLPGNLFPTLCTTNAYSYHPLFLPANEKIACTCSQTASQSALRSLPLFTLEISVDLHLQFSQAAGLKRLFPHPPSTFLSHLYRCLSPRELFCRPLALIHSIGNVIPSTSIVKNGAILVIPF